MKIIITVILFITFQINTTAQKLFFIGKWLPVIMEKEGEKIPLSSNALLAYLLKKAKVEKLKTGDTTALTLIEKQSINITGSLLQKIGQVRFEFTSNNTLQTTSEGKTETLNFIFDATTKSLTTIQSSKNNKKTIFEPFEIINNQLILKEKNNKKVVLYLEKAE